MWSPRKTNVRRLASGRTSYELQPMESAQGLGQVFHALGHTPNLWTHVRLPNWRQSPRRRRPRTWSILPSHTLQPNPLPNGHAPLRRMDCQPFQVLFRSISAAAEGWCQGGQWRSSQPSSASVCRPEAKHHWSHGHDWTLGRWWHSSPFPKLRNLSNKLMCIAPWLSNKVAMIQEYFLPIKLPRFARSSYALLTWRISPPPLLFCTTSA